MILRSNRNTATEDGHGTTIITEQSDTAVNGINSLEQKLFAYMDRHDKRLGRLEKTLKLISQALNVDEGPAQTTFLKNDLNIEGWLHEYTFGTRVYHAGYHGHVIKETRLRVIFRTEIDGNQVALSVTKSDIGREGQFTLFEQCN